MIKYKIDIIQALESKGYTSYKLRHDKVFSQGTITRLKNQRAVTIGSLNKLCGLLDCQLGDIIEHVRESDNTKYSDHAANTDDDKLPREE